MKQIVAPFVIAFCLCTPAQAETKDDTAPSLMERGTQLFLEGLLNEMEPAIKDLKGFAQDMGPAMQNFVQNMGPAMADIFEKVEDWSVYHPPEILPNGDIILRKKTKPEPPKEGQIDL